MEVDFAINLHFACQMTIGATLATAAAFDPGKAAFVMEEKSMSYAEADAASNQFANALLSKGAAPGDNIAVIGHNSIEYAISYFGIARAGCASLHLSPRMTGKELEYCLKGGNVRLTICDPDIPAIDIDVRVSLETEQFDQFLEGSSVADPGLEPSIDSPSSATYTGGTTGFPKGGMHTARSRLAWATIAQEFFSLTPQEVMANAAPMGHAAGGFIWFQPGVCAGATQVLLRHWSTKDFVQAVERETVTSTFLVPTQIQMLLDSDDFDPTRLQSIKKIVYGGAPAPDGLIERASGALTHCEFIQNYGMTEIGPLITLYKDDRKVFPSALGRPTRHTDWAIFTPSAKKAAVGEIGELCFRGPTLMTGYVDDPKQTDEFFRHGDGWGWTGDLAVINKKGVITLAGRSKDMIISGGLNIYPAEIERVFNELLVVKECAVFGVPDEKFGELPAIAVVTEKKITADEILYLCEKKLARHKRPRRIEFVDKLPKSPAGKVLRTVLRNRFK